ncbi:torsin-1A-interacting protein 2-like isoform X2 [Hypomesus transpacificus]|uniref:torsin-1A-interacting protein 2-like isoform X2 n=1 Tax=Hypomesus transpacificus TaxID=137520 RepID=UPI001F07358E|nr:torsin-1A-interacting protein 2-like isoform X2 [Hypomesus transpacificus]
MSEANTISQGSNDTSLPPASGSSDAGCDDGVVPNGSEENTQGNAIKASEGPTEQTASTPRPEAQSEAFDSRGNSGNSESFDSIQLPVEVKTNTAECKQNKPEKEDDDKQRLFDEQSKDPPLETPTTDSPSPHGGVEDVPGGRVEDVPGEGVEDIPDGRRTNYSSGLNQPEQEGDEKQDEEPVVQPPGQGDGVEDIPVRWNKTAKEEPGVKLPVEVETITTAECEQEKPEKEDDDKQRLFVEQSKDPRLETPTTDPPSTSTKLMLIGILGLVLSIFCAVLLQPKSAPEKTEVSRVDVFLKEMERVTVQFPSQHLELWRRSRIHLTKHLQTAHPKEPASLILTAGRRAEKTLHCLAQGLASALSSALNGSVLQIDGDSMAGQDSNQVKFDIDDKLRHAFEGDKPVAVIHRFEELPPGSTIIFYRYCDHENAAYKRASLIFTVLLEGKEEVSASLGLSAVEEMVDDHLKDKFLSSDQPAAFDSMDTDKLSGLWSRISHLILPVAAEERIEQHGCVGT